LIAADKARSTELTSTGAVLRSRYIENLANVAAQRRDPNSLMDWNERMIRMRKEVPEIGWDDFSIIPTGKPEVLAIRYDWRNNSVLFVHNLSAVPTEVEFGSTCQPAAANS
jgi:maltose alpha-D-glucosyltransferase / alpha-amylase